MLFKASLAPDIKLLQCVRLFKTKLCKKKSCFYFNRRSFKVGRRRLNALVTFWAAMQGGGGLVSSIFGRGGQDEKGGLWGGKDFALGCWGRGKEGVKDQQGRASTPHKLLGNNGELKRHQHAQCKGSFCPLSPNVPSFYLFLIPWEFDLLWFIAQNLE